MELLDKNNNPLTHAKYHREEVQEAWERDRRPLPLEIPQYLQENINEYLAQVSPHLVCERDGIKRGFFFNHLDVHTLVFAFLLKTVSVQKVY